MNGYSTKGDHSDLKGFNSLLKGAALKGKKYCTPWEQIIFFKSSPLWEGIAMSVKEILFCKIGLPLKRVVVTL